MWQRNTKEKSLTSIILLSLSVFALFFISRYFLWLCVAQCLQCADTFFIFSDTYAGNNYKRKKKNCKETRWLENEFLTACYSAVSVFGLLHVPVIWLKKQAYVILIIVSYKKYGKVLDMCYNNNAQLLGVFCFKRYETFSPFYSHQILYIIVLFFYFLT